MATSSRVIVPSAQAGACRLAGNTATLSAPTANVQVHLYHDVFPLKFVASLRSDDNAGWAFARLKDVRFAVIALDPAGVYDPACKVGLVPTPMPPDPAEHP